MRYSYYPGCSLHSTGVAYDKSVRATLEALGAELVEIDDWNCCGATAYMSVKETVARVASARNLALAEQAGLDIIAPCSACFTVLNKTRAFVRHMPEMRANVNASLQEAGISCRFDLPVRHPLEVLVNDFGPRELADKCVRNLAARRVAVVGGGNTAIDAARTALREAHKWDCSPEVTILYRRTREEMPAEDEELDDALAEGVCIRFLVAPTEVVGKNGHVTAVRCVEMKLGDPDDSGRRRPIPVPDSECDLPFDQVITAISQKPDTMWADGYKRNGRGDVRFTRWESVEVDPESLQTDIEGVFAGGDVVLGPSTVVQAMGQGRRAAEAINKYVRGEPLPEFRTHAPRPDMLEPWLHKSHPGNLRLEAALSPISVEKLDTPCGRIQHTRKLIGRKGLQRNGAASGMCAPKISTGGFGAHLQRGDPATQLSAC